MQIHHLPCYRGLIRYRGLGAACIRVTPLGTPLSERAFRGGLGDQWSWYVLTLGARGITAVNVIHPCELVQEHLRTTRATVEAWKPASSAM